MTRKRKSTKRASPRQRRKYGLNGARVPEHEWWKLELDPKYLKALQNDPEAAQWLSIFNEEVSRGVYQEGEVHLHTRNELRALDCARKARAANRDVLSFKAHRGPALEEVEAGGVDAGDWLAAQTGVVAGAVEDFLIEEIDRRAAVALRKEGEGEGDE